MNSEIITALLTLLSTNYAFSFSFVVYFMIVDVFNLNTKEGYRYSQVYWLLFLCVVYCILYQSGTIRWFIMGLNTAIPPFDEKFWMLLELFTQIIHFAFLYVVKKIMRSYKHDCEGVE